MGIELAKAYVVARGDTSKLKTDLAAARAPVEQEFGRLADVMSSKIMGAIGAISAGMSMLKGIQMAGQLEQNTIAFETMMGSAEKAKALLGKLSDFAAKTPFRMAGIIQAARGLVQFGEKEDQVMDTLNILGNAAAATSTDFAFLAGVFNQVRGVGKLLTQDFRQLATRGVISLVDIAKHFNVTTEAAQKMLSTGRISFEDLRAILKGLSSEGGRYFNLMEKQSSSLLGLWSTLQEELEFFLRDVMTPMVPALKVIQGVIIKTAAGIRSMVNPQIIQWAIALAGAVGTIKLAVVAWNLALKAVANSMIFVQALAGPAAWLKIGASIAVAAGYVYLMNQAMEEMEQKASGAAGAVKRIGSEAEIAAKKAEALKESLERRKKVLGTKGAEDLAGKPIRVSMGGGAGMFGKPGYMDMVVPKDIKEPEKLKELTRKVRDLKDELKGMSEASIDARKEEEKFLATKGGVTDEELGKFRTLRAVYEELQRTKEEHERERGVWENQKKQGGPITKSMMTPGENLWETFNTLKELKSVGAITDRTFIRALKAERKKWEDTRPGWVSEGLYDPQSYANALQQAFLRPDDPQKQLLREEAKQTGILQKIEVLLAKAEGTKPMHLVGP